MCSAMKPILEVARALGIEQKYLEPFGHYKAKLSLPAYVGRPAKGKLVLVSAITPTPAGEGKTTTSVGLAQGLAKIGVNSAVALREPSLGPVFGMKGGGAGGGASEVLPVDDINMHFTTRMGSGYNTRQYWKLQTYHNLSRNVASNGLTSVGRSGLTQNSS